jgi:hypothetical protein
MNSIDVKLNTAILGSGSAHVPGRPFRLMSGQRSSNISARVNVPTVIYSCGCLEPNQQSIVPRGIFAYAAIFATIPPRQVLVAME